MRFRRSHILTIVVILGLIAYACVTLVQLRSKANTASDTTNALQAEIAEVEESNAQLRYAIEHADDPSTMEDIARQKLGLVMPDEKIFYDAGG